MNAVEAFYKGKKLIETVESCTQNRPLCYVTSYDDYVRVYPNGDLKESISLQERGKVLSVVQHEIDIVMDKICKKIIKKLTYEMEDSRKEVLKDLKVEGGILK